MKTITLQILAVAAILLSACSGTDANAYTPADTQAVADTSYAEVELKGFVPRLNKPYANVNIPNKDGEKVALRQYIQANKVTLIDCWASWCPPCRNEMPKVVALYEKYHGQGLEIVGISFDNNKEAWLNAVERMNMTWPQLSELKGWENQMMNFYGVNAIPCTFLINQKGIIIGYNLHGEELDAAVAEALK